VEINLQDVTREKSNTIHKISDRREKGKSFLDWIIFFNGLLSSTTGPYMNEGHLEGKYDRKSKSVLDIFSLLLLILVVQIPLAMNVCKW